ncbi:MAG: efflux RND transporter periplasmic adaptor subunit [Syntrophobacteraceae bacterium]|nr:efflux RND transporter periplasmic adaptor subunit [Syntrophobacteraceae bacterium]
MSQPTAHPGKSPVKQELLKGILVLGLLVILMLWLAGGFIEKVQPAPPASKPPPPRYTTQKVERRTFPLVVEQVGTVRAQSEAEVSTRIMAQVREILVKEGDPVSGLEGGHAQATVLARLDDRDLRSRLQQAEQQLDGTERGVESAEAKVGAAKAQLVAALAERDRSNSDYRRYQELYRNQATTGQQFEQVKTQRDVAEARVSGARREIQAAGGDLERLRAQKGQTEAALKEARVMLSHAAIRAPFSGRVTRKLVDIGDMVGPGQPMFVIETVTHPELHASITESLVASLKPGQEMEAHVDAVGRTFTGRLLEIVPKSDPQTRTVLIKVGLPPDSGLVSGLFARLRVVHGQYESLVVPARSVREVGQLHLVDVMAADGHARRRFVTLGKTHTDVVEVLSGLKENEEIVVP